MFHASLNSRSELNCWFTVSYAHYFSFWSWTLQLQFIVHLHDEMSFVDTVTLFCIATPCSMLMYWTIGTLYIQYECMLVLLCKLVLSRCIYF